MVSLIQSHEVAPFLIEARQVIFSIDQGSSDLPLLEICESAIRNHSHSSRFRLVCSLHIFGILAGINAWFWWYKLHDSRNVRGNCVYYTFLFARLQLDDLKGSFRAVSALVCLVFLIVETLLLMHLSRAILQISLTDVPRFFLNARISDPSAGIRSAWLSRIASFLCFLFISFNIVVIQLTLACNPIQVLNGMAGPGQLKNVFIGASGLVRVLYHGLRDIVAHRPCHANLHTLDLPLQA